MRRCAWTVIVALVSGPAAAQASIAVDDSDRIDLVGAVHPAVAHAPKLGRAPAGMRMDSMLLVLHRNGQAQARVEALLAAQQDPASPLYHRWLSPGEFGATFGPTQAGVDAAASWLRAAGFRVDAVAASRMTITFSGVREQVESAFRTVVELYEVDGAVRYANSTVPSIPRALAGIVHGIVSLHDIPTRLSVGGKPLRSSAGRSEPMLDLGGGVHLIAPGDFATLYNVSPLYTAGKNGAGVTIAIAGRSEFNPSDVSAFRELCGLSVNSPTVIVNGTNPGNLGGNEELEADLDVTWSGAVAPNASVVFVLSASAATSGELLSAQYIVDNNVAPIMSTSFGACEAALGAAGNAFLANLWSQAAAQGITAFVSAGDSGPAGCQVGSATVGTAAAVSGYASTPYDVAVGGTMFNEGSGTYWSASNSASQSSALSYIPELPWNESGDVPGGMDLWAGAGGVSTLYAKPSWQSAPGVPSDGMRDIPDVSLSAAGHDSYLLLVGGLEYGVYGTSVASPAFAGLMALVVQAAGEPQGNANPNLYRLGNWQLANSGPQVFHDVTSGNTEVPGVSTCCSATPGYDMATGLGSVDANALVTYWGSSVVANIIAPSADLSVLSGTSVAFAGTGSDSNASAVLGYSWAFGDGSSGSGADVSHVFANTTGGSTIYTVTLTVSDGSGNAATALRRVTVIPVFSLSVSETGSGIGTVASSPPGISCAPACVAAFPGATVVALSATPASGSVFAGWSGAGCSGTGGCTVTLNQAQAVNATFLPTVPLTVVTIGSGQGLITGGGLNCSSSSTANCTAIEASGASITLTATPLGNSVFAGWSGAGCSGTGPCTIAMNQAESVVAAFVLEYSLTVVPAGSGSGQVGGGGLACSTASTAGCLAFEFAGTVATLSAVAAAGSTFTGWSGGGCAGTGTCAVAMTQAVTVTATFAADYTLSVTPGGNGGGTVTGGGIACSSGSSVGCVLSEAPGTVVTLSAAPSDGSTFAGWQGGGCTGTGSCTVAMTQAQSVAATFTLDYTLSVSEGGNGGGTVTGGGIACSFGSSVGCVLTEPPGTVVTLLATPNGSSTFAGWQGGGCSGSGMCTVTLSQSLTVQAIFEIHSLGGGGCQSGEGGGGAVVLAGALRAFLCSHRRRRARVLATSGDGKFEAHAPSSSP